MTDQIPQPPTLYPDGIFTAITTGILDATETFIVFDNITTNSLTVGSSSDNYWFEGPKLVGNSSGSFFGEGVCIFENFAIVGSSGNESSNYANIYENIGGLWTLVETLNPGSFVYFGTSVAIVSYSTIQTALISAGSYNTIGGVYVYQNTGSGWSQVTVLTPSDNIGSSNFGSSISLALNGTTYTAIIGGDEDNTGIGAAWIYQSTGGGGGWAEVTKIVPTNNIGDSTFGNSVSLVNSGNTNSSIIGGCRVNSSFGAAWIYQSIYPGGWSEVTKIIPTNYIGPSPYFGYSVDIEPNGANYTAIIGAPQDNSIGAVWIYGSQGGWTQEQKIIPTDHNTESSIGWSVSISGSFIAFGSYLAPEYNGPIWVYEYNGTIWTEMIRIIPPNALFPSQIGWATCINGKNLIFSGVGDNNDVGAAWIYTYENDQIILENGNIMTPGTITAGIFSGGTMINTDITSLSNNVAATSLVSSEGSLIYVNRTTPSLGQVLTASSTYNNEATWQTPTFSSILGSFSTATTSSFGAVTLNGKQGILTLTDVALNSGSVESVTVTNSSVTSSSAIILSVVSNSAGNCYTANVFGISTNTYDIIVCNVGPSVGPSVSISIIFFILN